MRHFFIVTALVAGSLSAAETVPLGHPDFYPSPERPIGWRGDGSGAWPGASTVTTWDAEKNINIVWKTPMPGRGFSQPIVIGEKVISMADPDLLVCVNVHDGKNLWQTRIENTLNLPAEQREKARIERQWIQDLRRQYGRWYDRYLKLLDTVKAKGLDPKAICIGGPGSRNYPGKPGELGEPADAALAEAHKTALADGVIKAEYDALRAEAAENAFLIPGDYKPPVDESHAHWKRALKAWRDFDLPFVCKWGEPDVSLTFSTPCTDGRLIYVTTSDNAVAAVDLSGKIQWLVWERIPESWRGQYAGRIGTRFVASPVLYGGKLIVHQNGLLRAYESTTGRKLWQIDAPNKVERSSQFPWRPIPEATSPMTTVLRLPDGRPLEILSDGGPNLYRLHDGKIISTALLPPGSGRTFLTGDLFVAAPAGDGRPVGRQVFRIKAISPAEAAVEKLWSMDKDGGSKGATDCFLDGVVYNGSFAAKALTGEVIRLQGRHGVPANQPSSIIIGRHIYGVDGPPQKTIGGVMALEGGPISPGLFVDRRIETEEEWAWRYLWVSTKHNNASPSAQANRLFWRSPGYLWCVGDPKQKFPTPKDCPQAAKVAP